MAKIAYTKLNAKINQGIQTIVVEGSDNPIEVLQYLPIDEKLGLIGRVIELAHDENNFSNPIKLQVFMELEMIDAYTNITFTEKQKENITKLYDALYSSGWLNKIMEAIPEDEREIIENGIYETVDAYYNYRNSVMGILDTVSQDYSDLNLDMTELQKKFTNGEGIELVKDIVTKLG